MQNGTVGGDEHWTVSFTSLLLMSAQSGLSVFIPITLHIEKTMVIIINIQEHRNEQMPMIYQPTCCLQHLGYHQGLEYTDSLATKTVPKLMYSYLPLQTRNKNEMRLGVMQNI